MTTWRPDTCECEVEYDNSTFTVIAVHKKCSGHSGVKDDALYEVVLKDNQTKNHAFNTFIEDFPEYTEEIPEEEISGGAVNVSTPEDMENEITRLELVGNEPRPRRLKKGIRMIYVFTGNDDKRHLQVKWHGLKMTAQTKQDFEKKLHKKIEHKRLTVV